MRARLFVGVILATLVSLLPVASVSADTETFEASFQIGEGMVSGVPIAVEGPAVVRAADGETLELTGSGNLSFSKEKGTNVIKAAGASGTGRVVHKSPSGAVLTTGTWEVTELLDFHSYGSAAAQDLPSNNWGGLALFSARFTPDTGGPAFEALMWVDCLLGSPPEGAQEGVRVAFPGIADFDEPVSGQTLFVAE